MDYKGVLEGKEETFDVYEYEDRGRCYFALIAYATRKNFLIGSSNSGYYQSEKQDAIERAAEWASKH
jgi:hypothetical protein